MDNVTRGITLATRTRVAGTSAERRRGLLGAESWGQGDALWIAPCEAIHTFGMKWPIDAVFLGKRRPDKSQPDGSRQIRKLSPGLPPRCIALCWKAASVLELPAGVLLESGTQVGDILTFHLTSG